LGNELCTKYKWLWEKTPPLSLLTQVKMTLILNTNPSDELKRLVLNMTVMTNKFNV
jgi:hypothetical protein